METIQALEKALGELKRITGIPLEVKADTPAKAEVALTSVRRLILSYEEKYNKINFLQRLMTDQVPSNDIFERATRLHIDPQASRTLFLVETKHMPDETITEILKNLLPSQIKTYLVPISGNRLALLLPQKDADTQDDISELAHMIVNTLNTEALTHVQVAYSGVIEGLCDLPQVFRETSLALQVGKVFYSEQTVFAHNQLGIGRLIYQLPVNICENFLRELFGQNIPHNFDEDITAIVNKLLQNNLNIAETARQLHMHRNTLVYRLEQIEKKTGLDIRKFEDAMTFRIATMVINYLRTERNT